MCEIAAVGELEGTDAAVIASLDNLLGHLGVFVIEYGDYACLAHLGEDGDLVKFSHCIIF